MMYGYGMGTGWMWFVGIVLVLILLAVTALIVIVSIAGFSTGHPGRPHPGATTAARQIAEERLARGDITPEEFRQVTRVLDERG